MSSAPHKTFKIPAALLLSAALLLAGCNETHAERGWDIPTDPQEKAAYDYAHSLKLPDSVPKPVPFNFALARIKTLWPWAPSVSAQYFDHLCKTEAGEYIFKTVDKVEGIYQMRPMPKRSDELLRDRYGFEDPADWSHGEADGSPTSFIGGPGNGFRYFESPRAPKDIVNQVDFEHWVVNAWDKPEKPPYWKYHDYDYTDSRKGPTADPEEALSARYAYTWRGIKRERDREFGIAGGELIVLDITTGEILGVRRSFATAKQYKSHLDWEFAYFCPGSLRPIRQLRVINKLYYPFSFVLQVIKPIDFDPVLAIQPKH